MSPEAARKAIAGLGRALHAQPQSLPARLALVQACEALGDGWSAAAWLSDACRVAPHDPALWMELARLLARQRRDPEIEAALRCGVLSNPENPPLLEALAELYLRAHRHAEAVPLYQALLRLRPDDARSLLHGGFCLEHAGKLDAAIDHYRGALARQPDMLEAHVDLAGVLWRAADFQGALRHARRAVALAPERAHALRILGTALMHLNRLAEAEEALREALRREPGLATGLVDLALLLLLAGRFEEGWALYRRRWEDTLRMARPVFWRPELEWQGPRLQPPAGRRIVVYAEQGLGDALQFIRYARLLQEDGAQVYAVVPAPLVPLVESMPGVVCYKPALTISADHHAALLDLPQHYATNALDPADRVPRGAYLRAPQQRAAPWRARLQPWAGKLKVGIAWAGNPAHPNDRNRSLPLSLFSPLLGLPGVQCFSLQKGDAGLYADLALEESALPDFTAEWQDFADSAAMLEQLDLVVSVDTAVVHLAAALGRPTWVLLPPNPDWRWLLEREDSPWYPSVRLFRRGHGEAAAVQMGRVAQALRECLPPGAFRSSAG